MYTDQEIIQEIRRVAALVGKTSLKEREFNEFSRISGSTASYRFGSWNEAVKAAGLEPIDPVSVITGSQQIPDEDLLRELIRLYNETGKNPTYRLLRAKGKFSEYPYKARWNTLAEAFQVAQKRSPDMTHAFPSTPKGEHPHSTTVQLVPPTIKPKTPRKERVVFGEPIDFRGLRFAPVNEQGVVYLFGMISHELGYLIESVRTAYPDSEGKRCFDKANNKWEHVRIEFEYKSSNFKQHGHNADECDIVVCWIHDWDDCPLEVLELKSTIKYL